MTSFEDYGLEEAVLFDLRRMGYKTPSPVQKETLPLILKGKDVMALAQTGSGKTAAAAIPICHLVDTKRNVVQALIVVPVRELGLQYAVETQKIGKKKGVKAFALLGGEDLDIQLAKIKSGVHVLIATPGRLIDLVYQRLIDLDSVKTLVLDEADEMLSMGFYDDLAFIMQCLTHDHQTLLFSATMPPAISTIAKQHMNDPVEITLIEAQASPQKIEHRFVYCPKVNQRILQLKNILDDIRPPQSLIFCNSRKQTEEICKILRKKLSSVDFLHGGLAQNIRSSITNRFRQKKTTTLVVTDVAARGLDFSGVTHVIIYQLSPNTETYIHRVGRTGRSGRHGVSITFITDRDRRSLQEILKKIQQEPIWIGHPPRFAQSRSTSPSRNRRES